METKELTVKLNNPEGYYYCGEEVSGFIILNLDEPQKIRKITVTLKGEANSSWNKKVKKESTDYNDNENYFEHTVMVLGEAGKTEELSSGEHCFQFKMILQNNLPSSFEGKHGYVRYEVKVTAECPWKLIQEENVPFTIIGDLDLNNDPQNKKPAVMETSKMYNCFFCKTGPITFTSRLPASGFIPGQSVPITVEIENPSNVHITQIECLLQKIATYYANESKDSQEECMTISMFKFQGPIGIYDSKTWSQNLRIPLTAPSMPDDCRIIKVRYEVWIVAKPEGIRTNLEHKMPIVIGTVQLQENKEAQEESLSTPQLVKPAVPNTSVIGMVEVVQ